MPKISAIGNASCQAARLATSARHRGFTLVELMVVLAIMVLLASALPFALNRALPARRAAAAADALVADIQWMKIQAAAHGDVARLALFDSGYQVSVQKGGPSRTIHLRHSTSLKLHALADDRVVKELIVFPDGSNSSGWFDIVDSGKHERVEVAMLTGRPRRAD